MSEWTAERFDLLKELATVGTNRWIAWEINRRTGSAFTRNSIIGKKAREGLKSAEPPGTKNGVQIARAERRNDRALQTKLGRKKRQRQMPEMQNSLYSQEFFALPLIALERGDCRYPQGDGPFLFCGQPSIEGSSYCLYHHRLCCNGIPERPLKRTTGMLSLAWGGV